MIKKILIIIGLFVSLLLLLFSTTNFKKSIVVTQNNDNKQALTIKLGEYTDRYCNMSITKIEYSAQAIMPNNDTFFFDDVGCMISWLKEQKNNTNIILWVYAKDIKQYIHPQYAWFTINENTPMEYGFGAYSIKKENMIDFDTMRLKVYRGETLQNVLIKQNIQKNIDE
jgi:hypothetical protein